MKISLLIISMILFSQCSFAQKDIQPKLDSIVAEGKLLYRSEMASWYGTDIFLEKFTDKSRIGGYLSYSNKDVSTCIFFSSGESPKVIGTMKFDNTYNVKTADVDLTERNMTDNERSLYIIRTVAKKFVQQDTFFKHYTNSDLNFIPLISGNEKKLYILTGPKKNGVVIFGNDYLINFDAHDSIISKRRLHKNIISIDYESKNEDGTVITETIHTHLPETGDFMTATDICTLMLYEKFTSWKKHMVVSKNYYNFWDCEKDSLFAITKEVMEKINKDSEKRRKGN